LDVNVQEEFEKFLRERGIAEGLALFIPEFAEHKEQKVRLPPLIVPVAD
jgi:complement component 1 Q subcomponent-binding protein, mitochondrial